MESRSPAPSIVLPYAEAAQVVQEHARLVLAELQQTAVANRETVPLAEAAGRVLAEAIIADRDQPPFRRSTRDGFAGRAAEVNGGDFLLVSGQIRAGDRAVPLGRGEAVEIMTGAPLPEEADGVVMIEHVVYEPDQKRVALAPGRKVSAGENFVAAGAEAQNGKMVLPANLRLQPRHIAVSAGCGATRLQVFAKPHVAIIATGDELVEVEAQPEPHQIRNSNSYSLAAQVGLSGGVPLREPIAPDRPDAIRTAILASSRANLLLLSGGVSMGRYDFVEQVVLDLGAEFFFTGAEIQPGRPVVFGRLPQESGDKYFFGLPGNPVSTMVTYALFVAPLLAALGGESGTGPRFVLARMGRELKVKPGLTRFLPASLSDGLVPSVEAVSWQGSGDLAATAKANCFVVAPANRDRLEEGETVSILLA